MSLSTYLKLRRPQIKAIALVLQAPEVQGPQQEQEPELEAREPEQAQ